MEVSQKAKNRTILWPNNSIHRHISEKNQNTDLKRYVHPNANYTMEYYSAIKKWNLANCGSIDGLRGHYVKWNRSEKDKYCMLSLIFGISKNTTN